MSENTILIVDDEEINLQFISAVLTRQGLKVFACDTHHDALDFIKTNIKRVCLIIHDVIMPEGEGTLMADTYRDLNPSLPILFVSGFSQDEDLMQRLADSATEFLAKPFTGDELMKKVYALSL